MRRENLITGMLWSAALQAAMAATTLAADPAPGVVLPPPPLPMAEQKTPAPAEAVPAKAAVPEPASVPVAPSPQPMATGIPAPAPQADSISAGGTAPGPGTCPRGICGCRSVDCRELPFGACFCAHVKTQICNGMAARLILYQYDFCDPERCDGYKLSPKGYQRLQDIARMFSAANFPPIIVESTPQEPKLDAARRAYVWKSLVQMNVPVPEQLVVVGQPRTPALNGQHGAGNCQYCPASRQHCPASRKHDAAGKCREGANRAARTYRLRVCGYRAAAHEHGATAARGANILDFARHPAVLKRQAIMYPAHSVCRRAPAHGVCRVHCGSAFPPGNRHRCPMMRRSIVRNGHSRCPAFVTIGPTVAKMGNFVTIGCQAHFL